MWNLAKGKHFLPEISAVRLKVLYWREKKTLPQLRLLGAIHRKQGKSIDEIAYLLSKPRRTVHGWITRFQEKGISAKDSIKQTGRPTEMSLSQRKKLVKDLERGPPHNSTGLWTTKDVRNLLEKKYGQQYVKQHVWRLLVSLGFSMQRPRKQHYQRASEDELLQFKKKLDGKRSITVRKDLLLARKMRQLSD